MGQKGVEAFKLCKGSLRDKVVAYFDSEPEEKMITLLKSNPQTKEVIIESTNKVQEIILSEEEKYIKLLDSGNSKLKKMFPNPESFTGENLAKAHHTYGYDPSTVEAILNIELSSNQHDMYLSCMEVHKQNSKNKTKNKY